MKKSIILVIVLVILAGMAAYWFNLPMPPPDFKECPEGVVLSIGSYNCTEEGISLEVKNRGLFVIENFEVYSGDVFITLENVSLSPGENKIFNYKISDGELIRIVPFSEGFNCSQVSEEIVC
jgi:hypothetical protein